MCRLQTVALVLLVLGEILDFLSKLVELSLLAAFDLGAFLGEIFPKLGCFRSELRAGKRELLSV